jgi:hypothetical protein
MTLVVPELMYCIECFEEKGRSQVVRHRLGAWHCPIHRDYCHVSPNMRGSLNYIVGRASDRNILRERALSAGRSVEEIAPPVPTPETDAAPPEGDDTKMIMLAGAIKAWWMHRCPACHRYYDNPATCLHLGTPFYKKVAPDPTIPMWDSPEHQAYLEYRRDLQTALIATNRYLTYAPHNAMKGRWVESAQSVNDAAIEASDLMVIMSPENVPTEGTDSEVLTAAYVNTNTLFIPSNKYTAETALWTIDMFFEIQKSFDGGSPLD